MDQKVVYYITESQHFPSKVACSSKLQALSKIKQKLNEAQLSLFEKSCFGKLLQMEQLQFSGQVVHNLLLRQIESSAQDEMWFALKDGRPFRFGLQEFLLITGLNCGPLPTSDTDEEEHKEDGSFCISMLNGSMTVTVKALESLFLEATSDIDEDLVKLALLYFLETVLLGKDQKTHINKDHILLLDDLHTFNKYPWGCLVYDVTLASLKKNTQKKAHDFWQNQSGTPGKRKRENPVKSDSMWYYVHGFAYAFQVWAFEAIPDIWDGIASKTGTTLPRIIGWRC